MPPDEITFVREIFNGITEIELLIEMQYIRTAVDRQNKHPARKTRRGIAAISKASSHGTKPTENTEKVFRVLRGFFP